MESFFHNLFPELATQLLMLLVLTAGLFRFF